ncbi:MAG: hypothetical protein PWQ70_3126 [Clostridiales bacterium]|nr:hypothetical protein [Clostridiales bacterium]
MISILLDGVIYLRPNLTIKQDDKFIIIFNDSIEVKRIEYSNSTTATTKFNGIIGALKGLNDNTGPFFINLDSLL